MIHRTRCRRRVNTDLRAPIPPAATVTKAMAMITLLLAAVQMPACCGVPDVLPASAYRRACVSSLPVPAAIARSPSPRGGPRFRKSPGKM